MESADIKLTQDEVKSIDEMTCPYSDVAGRLEAQKYRRNKRGEQ